MKELKWITNKLRYDINAEKSEIKNAMESPLLTVRNKL